MKKSISPIWMFAAGLLLVSIGSAIGGFAGSLINILGIMLFLFGIVGFLVPDKKQK